MGRRPAAYVPPEEDTARIDVERVRRFGHTHDTVFWLPVGVTFFLMLGIWIVSQSGDLDITGKALLSGWFFVLVCPPVLVWMFAYLRTGRRAGAVAGRPARPPHLG